MSVMLVVDDDRTILQMFRRNFAAQVGITLETADSGRAALQLLARRPVDTVVLDVPLPDLPGLQVFEQIRQLDPKLPVIFITAEGSSETAIEAMQRGALDYLSKPLDWAQVRQVVERAFAIRRLMVASVQIDPAGPQLSEVRDAIVGRCPGMQAVYKAIGRVAAQPITVLIRGESGTGKELVARALYQNSKRRQAPFLAVNCAAIPETMLESELFGHERGAFTGADRRRIGKFEQCNGGTLFLDEIGDMSPPLQSKLLRVLQEQRFERLGGNDTVETNVRVLAATNRDMEQMVARNEFRGDLYYRLNGYTINLPALRDRGDDLLLLIDHFLAQANQDLGKQIRGFTPEAVAILRTYHWPGNVRELQSVIRQSVLDTAGPVVFADALPQVVITRSPDRIAQATGMGSPAELWREFVRQRIRAGSSALYDEALQVLERMLISQVLRATGGNQGEAVRILGITRTTLRTKIRKLGISMACVIQDEPAASGNPVFEVSAARSGNGRKILAE